MLKEFEKIQCNSKKFRREEDLRGCNIRADKVQVSKKVRAFDLEGLAEDRRKKYGSCTLEQQAYRPIGGFHW